jgi:hypothetical protein
MHNFESGELPIFDGEKEDNLDVIMMRLMETTSGGSFEIDHRANEIHFTRGDIAFAITPDEQFFRVKSKTDWSNRTPSSEVEFKAINQLH